MYVDGYVLPLKKSKLSEYKKMATDAGKFWIKCGALGYYECVGDDLNPNMKGMKFTKFADMAKAKPSETVVFSFVIYKNRKHRDSVNAKIMKSMKAPDCVVPFDVTKMAYGGFKPIVELKK